MLEFVVIGWCVVTYGLVFIGLISSSIVSGGILNCLKRSLTDWEDEGQFDFLLVTLAPVSAVPLGILSLIEEKNKTI